MVLSRTDLDETPEGWLEELVLQEAGWDMAAGVVRHRQKSKRNPVPGQQGQAVYGMPGARFVPGEGIQ